MQPHGLVDARVEEGEAAQLGVARLAGAGGQLGARTPQQLVVDGPCDDATKPSCGLKSRVEKYKDGFTKRAYCVASGYKYADGTPVPDCVTGGAWNAPKCDCAKKVPKPSWLRGQSAGGRPRGLAPTSAP